MLNSHLPHDDDASPSEARAVVQRLFDAHYAELCQFAYRCVRSRALAEELVQDVFLKVWQQQGRGQEEQPVSVSRAYFYRAVRNHALDYLKHERVEQRWTDQVRQQGNALAPAPDLEIDSAFLAAAAREAVDRLPERCRLVFLLRREQGLSQEEIAETVGISVKTVENHMGRALRLLRSALAPYLSVGVLVVSAAEVSRLFR